MYIGVFDSLCLSVSSYRDMSLFHDLVLKVFVLISALLHTSCFPYFFLLQFSSVYSLEVLL